MPHPQLESPQPQGPGDMTTQPALDMLILVVPKSPAQILSICFVLPTGHNEPHPQCAHPDDHCLQGWSPEVQPPCMQDGIRIGREGRSGGQYLHWHPALSPAGVHDGLHEK